MIDVKEKMKRIEWVDTLKGLGIILVVVGHSNLLGPTLNGGLIKYIYSFHMPLFFLISGFLYNHQKYAEKSKNFLVSRVNSLIIPYLFFAVFSYMFWVFRGLFGSEKFIEVSFYKPLFGIMYGNAKDGGLEINGPLWFLTTLFTTELLFYFLMKFLKNRYVLIVALIMCSIAGYLFGTFFPRYSCPWSIEIALTGIVFYASGFFIRQYQWWQLLSGFHTLIGIVASFLLNLLFCMANKIHFVNSHNLQVYNHVDMAHSIYGNYFYFYFSAFSGIAFYLLITMKLKNSKFISMIGRNSLGILGFHYVAFVVLYQIIHALTRIPFEKMSTMWGHLGLLVTPLAIIIVMPCIIVTRPFLYALKIKNHSVTES